MPKTLQGASSQTTLGLAITTANDGQAVPKPAPSRTEQKTLTHKDTDMNTSFEDATEDKNWSYASWLEEQEAMEKAHNDRIEATFQRVLRAVGGESYVLVKPENKLSKIHL